MENLKNVGIGLAIGVALSIVWFNIQVINIKK